MTAQEFQSSVGTTELPPIVFLYGEEDFLIDECLQAVLNQILDDGTRGFNLDVVYGSKVDVKEVVALASAFPMMSARRVVVVKEFERLAVSEPAREQLSAYLRDPLASTCLVAVSSHPDLRKKPFTDLKKHAAMVECKPLYDNKVPDWISRRIQSLGKTADPDACRMLQAYVGNSLRALQNEIDKLFIFVGAKKEISGEDVAQVVGASKGYTVFELQNAVGRRDLKESLTILQAMLQAGQSPQLIIIMLTRFLNQLWKLGELKASRAPDAEIAREVGVHPFFLRQLIEFQRGFPQDHIENGYRALLEADTILKTTSREPAIVLDIMVYTLVRGVVEPEHVNQDF
ncbi:MAG: DNA polymerase III subunit delta [Ignavibacteriales bacterium]|nr:DNA polymerase III subunit delta [Ignavibacteriales bacterium]